MPLQDLDFPEAIVRQGQIGGHLDGLLDVSLRLRKRFGNDIDRDGGAVLGSGRLLQVRLGRFLRLLRLMQRLRTKRWWNLWLRGKMN